MSSFGKTVLAAVLGGSVTLGAYKAFDENKTVVIEKVPENFTRTAAYNVTSDDAAPFDFTVAAERTTPAVVHIRNTMAARRGQSQRPVQIPEPFRDFFGDQFDMMDPNPRPSQATGSGVIISKDGYIVTNNHVIDNATELEVTLVDKRTFKAKVIGTDPKTDLALIKVEAKDLPTIPLGNSNDVKVGEWVLAVGNPFNLNSTVTAGIVSAKARSIYILGGGDAVESFIQTDAAVNPGNSGGALVNTRGELIGINTAIASQTGSYAGYAFAVPTSIVSRVVEDLISYGKVQRASLGIVISNLSSAKAEELGITISQGVVVDSLVADGAAQAAGIRKGDVVVRVDDRDVNSVPQLQEVISSRKPGETVKVIVNRKGKEVAVNVPLKTREGAAEVAKVETSATLKGLGADFENLTANDKKQGISEGVKVNKLYPGKLRSETDMREGFVIQKVNGKKVNSVNELASVLEREKEGVMLEGKYPGNSRTYYYAFGME
jgi:serine protease Do